MYKIVAIFVGLVCIDNAFALELPELCTEPSNVGSCKAAILRYFYNNQTQQCEQFTYGGCDANDNNFLGLEDCQACCVNEIHNCACSLQPKTGPCEALITRYYYDSATRTCKSFIYGGCQGNDNNFLTVDDCQRRCFADK